MKAKKKKLHTQPPELKAAIALPKEKRCSRIPYYGDKNYEWKAYDRYSDILFLEMREKRKAAKEKRKAAKEKRKAEEEKRIAEEIKRIEKRIAEEIKHF